jgi:hypothetical protein
MRRRCYPTGLRSRFGLLNLTPKLAYGRMPVLPNP